FYFFFLISSLLPVFFLFLFYFLNTIVLLRYFLVLAYRLPPRVIFAVTPLAFLYIFFDYLQQQTIRFSMEEVVPLVDSSAQSHLQEKLFEMDNSIIHLNNNDTFL